jgi:hypothetical protein
MYDLIETKNAIAERIQKRTRRRTGLPTSMLWLLCCPHCGREFRFDNINMNHRFIFAADLTCVCGYKAQIVDGVLYTANKNTSQYDRPDLTREYYKDIPSDLTSLFQRSYNWMGDKLAGMDLANKLVAETHINAYFFLQRVMSALNPTASYIIVDKFPEMLHLYKSLIESIDVDLNIFYLADNSQNWPIVPHSIDLFIDYFSTNEHQFSSQSWLQEQISPFIKDGGEIIGTYFYFKNGKISMRNLLSFYPEACNHNFNLPRFLQAMKDSHWCLTDNVNIGCTKNSGKNWAFSYHVDGEEMHLFSYHARRKIL